MKTLKLREYKQLCQKLLCCRPELEVMVDYFSGHLYLVFLLLPVDLGQDHVTNFDHGKRVKEMSFLSRSLKVQRAFDCFLLW